MLHVFLLMVYLGASDTRRVVSDDMHFYSIDRCNYFASRVTKRYGNYGKSAYLPEQDRVTAYCIPKLVDPEKVYIYR